MSFKRSDSLSCYLCFLIWIEDGGLFPEDVLVAKIALWRRALMTPEMCSP